MGGVYLLLFEGIRDTLVSIHFTPRGLYWRQIQRVLRYPYFTVVFNKVLFLLWNPLLLFLSGGSWMLNTAILVMNRHDPIASNLSVQMNLSTFLSTSVRYE